MSMPFADPTSAGNLIDPLLLDAVFADHGMAIRWYPQRRCSCWGQINGQQVASGAPDPACTICGGMGRLYTAYQNINGVILDGMQNLANWREDSGVNYTGTIRMFVPAEINGQTVDLYAQGTLGDLIWAEDIVLTTRTAVQRGVDETRERPIGPVAITWGTTSYDEGVDFRVLAKKIQWISAGPPAGQNYEATYSYHPWFSITQGQAIARNFAHLNLPRTFVLELQAELGETFRG